MRRTIILILFLALLIGQKARSQQVNATQKLSAVDSIRVLMDNYRDWHRFTIDGVNLSDSIVNRFFSLFDEAPDLQLLNDLQPKATTAQSQAAMTSTSGPIGLSDYRNQVIKNYKRGLFVEVEYELDYQAEIHTDSKGGGYHLFLPIKKSITGFYQGRKVHRYEGEQVLNIGFRGSGMEVSDFRIMEVITPKELDRRELNNRWKGFYAGITVSANQNHLLYGLPFAKNPQAHLSNNAIISYSFGAVAQYYFGARAGFETGILFRNYRVSQTITGFEHRDDNLLIDRDNDRYYRIAEVDSFSSDLNLAVADIPVMFNLRLAVSPGAAWNLQFGVRNLLILNSTSEVSGKIEYKGFYPDYPVILHGLPEYGFTSERFNGEKVPVETSSYTLLGSAGTGLDFRIGRKFLLGIGARADYSALSFSTKNTALNGEYHELILPSESNMMIFNVYFNLLYKIY